MSKSTVLLDSYLKTLRLPTFLREYPRVARECGEANKAYETFLELLSEQEVTAREIRSIQRRIKEASFPVAKELSDFDFSACPKLPKKRILDLSKCEFTQKRENVVFLGPPGVGKTHLAISLARDACRRGLRVKYFTAAGLVNAYVEAREKRQVQRLEGHIENRHLIVVDELGYIPFSTAGAEYLFSFFSRCYERTSVLVTTNLPFTEWPQIFGGDERLAGALLDRLTHRVHIVEMQGDSYRLKASLKAKEGGDQVV